MHARLVKQVKHDLSSRSSVFTPVSPISKTEILSGKYPVKFYRIRDLVHPYRPLPPTDQYHYISTTTVSATTFNAFPPVLSLSPLLPMPPLAPMPLYLPLLLPQLPILFPVQYYHYFQLDHFNKCYCH